MSNAMPPKRKPTPQSQPLVVDKEKQNVKVVARVRPMSKLEEEVRVRCIVKCVSQREIMTRDKKFHFDRVFKPDADQLEVYLSVVAPMISDVIAGYNCTVFAYGQTGSGKTYTMTGDNCRCLTNWREDLGAGCIPRAATHIFEELQLEKNENNIKVSYLELYNEEIRDLLSDDESLLAIYNDTKGSVFIQGLTEISVHDSEGLCKQLQKGILKRQTAPTLMNHQSSRSHTVFTITVHTRESTISGEDILKTGKLNLVDLAGSENIARSGCKDVRAVELANINKSLLTLGRVIHALAERQRHVPYRDSKLTRILQDSLGGHTKTCIIATISPAATAFEETISTLEYASRARDIKNTPTINEKLTKAQMMQGLLNEIDRLQKDLDAARDKSGFFVDKENYQRLIDSVEAVTGEKLTMEELTRKQAKRIEELEEIMRTRTKEFDDNVNKCKKSKELLARAKELIKEKKAILEQEQFVAHMYEAEASQLHEKAEQLFSTTKVLSLERGILQEKLQRQYSINIANQTTGQSAASQILEMLSEISEEGEKLKISDETVRNLGKEDINDLKVELQRPLEEVRKLLDHFNSNSLEELAIRDSIKTAVIKYIGIIRERTLDMKAMLTFRFDRLNKFAVENIGTFAKDFKLITRNYTYAVQALVSQIHKTLAAEDLSLNQNIVKLEQEILTRKQQDELMLQEILIRNRQDELMLQEMLIRKRQDELMFREKVEQDEVILNQIKVIKDQFLERNYEEKGEKVLDQIIKETNLSNERTEAMIANLEKTIVSELALGCKPEGIMTTLEQFDKEVTSLSTRSDENQLELASMKGSLASKMEEVSDVLDTKVNIIDSRFDFLMDDRESFEKMFENFVTKTDKILKEGFLQKFVPVKHEGDTPLRPTVAVTKLFKPIAPREALIEKFNEQKTLSGDEDKENLPNELNESTFSFKSFSTSGSECNLEEKEDPPN